MEGISMKNISIVVATLLAFSSGYGCSGVTKTVAHESSETLSLGSIAHIQWSLAEMNGEKIVSAPPTLFIKGDNASGFGGCNRYSSKIKETGKQEVTFGLMISTKMACPDEQMGVEDRYLENLGKVTRFSLPNGRLLLGLGDDTKHGQLIFSRDK